jgi:DNA-binding LytR/AlgR family response regulator
MKIKSLIIDDESLAREGLTEYVEKVDFIELSGICKNAIEANSFLQQNDIDLIFLDIHMPEMSGIEWLKSLSDAPLVIMTTAFREYAADGYDMEVIDYLVKPISFQRFLKACNKALKTLEQQRNTLFSYQETGDKENNHFFIKSDSKFIKIPFEDVLYIEGLKDYVAIHTTTKKYLALISLKNVESRLPKHKFVRTHRSFIVSTSKIDSIEGAMIKIKNAVIPISRELQEQIYSLVLQDKLWKR